MTNKNIHDLSTATAYDSDNEKLGAVTEVFINDATGQPDFVEVGHGLFGMNSSLVPLRGHRLDADDLHLAFPKDRIKDAPSIDADVHLDPQQLEALYRHYGLESTQDIENYDDPARDAQLADRTGTGVTPPLQDRGTEEGGALTRSEERLNVSKDRETTGEARLRKYVVHDTETVEVPVEREEVRVERTPIDPDEAANYRGDISEGEASVTLHEERVQVSKDSVPVEKVNLDKEKVTDTETVTEDVAKEKIETEGVSDKNAKRRGR